MNLRTLHLSPESSEGGSFTSGITDRGNSGTSESSSTPQYVPKGDFDRVSKEFGDYRTQNERRWQDFETRLPKPEKKESSSELKNPYKNMGDYKFQDAQGRPNADEMERFNEDVYRFHHGRFQKEQSEKEAPLRQQQQEIQFRRGLEQKFNSAAREYERENPGFLEKYRTQPLEAYDEVQDLIRDSDMGPAIYEHLIDHPETLQEMQSVMMSALQSGNKNWLGIGERFLGRLESTIESQHKLVSQRQSAFRAEPTSGGFPRGNVPKKESFLNPNLSPEKKRQLKDAWR